MLLLGIIAALNVSALKGFTPNIKYFFLISLAFTLIIEIRNSRLSGYDAYFIMSEGKQ